MSGSDRKPVVVALCCAAAAVLFFVTGASGPVLGDREASGKAWQERLDNVRIGAPVTAGDLLAIGASCTVGQGTISWSGSCLLRIEEFGGRFSLRPAKNFTARVGDCPREDPDDRPVEGSVDCPGENSVDAVLEVQDTTVKQTVEPGGTIEFTVGRSGGFLGLQCPGLDGCVLRLE